MSYAIPATENRHPEALSEERLRGEELTDLLALLDDPDCRAVLEATGERPMSAKEIVEHCEIPSSTAYRKIDRLLEAGLLQEGIRLRSSGKHTSEYRRCLEHVALTIEDGETTARVTHR